MDLKNLAIGIVFLLQSTTGFLGNFSLLFCYLIHYYIKQTLKTTDLILTHLFTANSLIMLSKGMLETIQALGMKGSINDFGCKLLLYIDRLGRSMSISSTCLLSVFQAITLSPSDSCWNGLKLRASKHIGLFASLCWIVYISVNLIFPVYMNTKRNINNLTQKTDMKYCTTVGHDPLTGLLYIAFFVFPETLFSLIIISSSSSMVVILYRHKQKVQHIRRNHVYSRKSPESRATQSILILVFTFLGFYALSTILHGCIALINNPGWWLLNITAVISMCFPTLGPFVMSHDVTVPRLCNS
ncbi:vomeronasal type-1 receptor 4-like [Sigmodon hispidus]